MYRYNAKINANTINANPRNGAFESIAKPNIDGFVFKGWSVDYLGTEDVADDATVKYNDAIVITAGTTEYYTEERVLNGEGYTIHYFPVISGKVTYVFNAVVDGNIEVQVVDILADNSKKTATLTLPYASSYSAEAFSSETAVVYAANNRFWITY